MRKKLPFLVYFILALLLFLGTNEQRIKKANFISKTIYSPFINSIRKIENLFEIKKQNRLLSDQIAQKTIKVRELEQNLSELSAININFDIKPQKYELAEIIGYNGRFHERNLIIDKGLLDGIKKDFPVIYSNGIVGKVISTSQNYSIVLPFNHYNFHLGIMLKRNKLQGILESNIYGKSYMTMVKLGADIKLGDVVVTSNISSIFPKGYPVGTVTKLIEEPNKLFVKAEISTFVDPSSLDQIIILYFEKDRSYEQELKNN